MGKRRAAAVGFVFDVEAKEFRCQSADGKRVFSSPWEAVDAKLTTPREVNRAMDLMRRRLRRKGHDPFVLLRASIEMVHGKLPVPDDFPARFSFTRYGFRPVDPGTGRPLKPVDLAKRFRIFTEGTSGLRAVELAELELLRSHVADDNLLLAAYEDYERQFYAAIEAAVAAAERTPEEVPEEKPADVESESTGKELTDAPAGSPSA